MQSPTFLLILRIGSLVPAVEIGQPSRDPGRILSRSANPIMTAIDLSPLRRQPSST